MLLILLSLAVVFRARTRWAPSQEQQNRWQFHFPRASASKEGDTRGLGLKVWVLGQCSKSGAGLEGNFQKMEPGPSRMQQLPSVPLFPMRYAPIRVGQCTETAGCGPHPHQAASRNAGIDATTAAFRAAAAAFPSPPDRVRASAARSEPTTTGYPRRARGASRSPGSAPTQGGLLLPAGSTRSFRRPREHLGDGTRGINTKSSRKLQEVHRFTTHWCRRPAPSTRTGGR